MSGRPSPHLTTRRCLLGGGRKGGAKFRAASAAGHREIGNRLELLSRDAVCPITDRRCDLHAFLEVGIEDLRGTITLGSAEKRHP